MVDKINDEIDSLLKNNEVQQLDNKKIMFAWKKSATVKAIGKDAELTDFLSVLIGGVAVLFQSINFLQGSQQKMHSDSIHMTTYPLGGLLGLWIALEEIDLDNGPLFYYPGSHKLPYYLNSDYDNEGSFWKLGKQSYQAYEDNLAKEVVKRQISKEIFTAEKGDVLIWHANLLHGGMPHINPLKSRKSMVLHYYNTKAICYHEITQRPALIDLQ